MKLPYGITDFKKIRDNDLLYIDKTKYIELLEELNADYLFFIRPRRFGKSLFLSTLDYYYDLNHDAEFDKLFKKLYIGHNPTSKRNSYMVLKFNFSGLKTDSKSELEDSFRKTILRGLINFLQYYRVFFSNVEEIVTQLVNEKDLKHMMEIVFMAVKLINKKIYLIIDEYDHFANDIIAMGDSRYYQDIVRARGFVRDFYETLKIGTQEVIDKLFITGSSPIMLDDLTSGFNITLNITMDPMTNEMLGFTENEVASIISQAQANINFPDWDMIKKQLKEYYNGYLFNQDSDQRVYNPEMILYYFDYFLRHKVPPRELITDNVKIDYGRLERLTINQKNREVLEEIIKSGGITANIISRFSFDRSFDQKYFVSLLFYMGLLTIDKVVRTRLLLKIPNLVIKTIYWEYFEQKIRKT
ncbi:MAG: AAA family ATPase [Halanaerobiales bacterium]|nr:AAA family ATPase [Halanaerobiales bacterium]